MRKYDNKNVIKPNYMNCSVCYLYLIKYNMYSSAYRLIIICNLVNYSCLLTNKTIFSCITLDLIKSLVIID